MRSLETPAGARLLPGRGGAGRAPGRVPSLRGARARADRRARTPRSRCPTRTRSTRRTSACRVDRDAGRPTVVRNHGAPRPARGSLHLRLRDVDLADVVPGAAPADRTRPTWWTRTCTAASASTSRASTRDQALAALEKTGVVLSAPGPAPPRLGRAAEELPATGAAADVPRVTLVAQARDRARRAGGDGGGASAAGRDGSLGTAGTDQPVDARGAAPDMRAVVLQAAGLEERVSSEGRLLERPGGTAETLGPLAGPGVAAGW